MGCVYLLRKGNMSYYMIKRNGAEYGFECQNLNEFKKELKRNFHEPETWECFLRIDNPCKNQIERTEL
jgi:hypothetical protein